MRGHFLSGTRKLNRHYQSGGGWKLIGDTTKTWTTDQKVLKDGIVTGYIPFDGVGNAKYKLPIKTGTRFKIVSDLPLYHLEYGTPEHASQTKGMTIGFAKLEVEQNGVKYYKNGFSNYDALYPQPKPFYRGIVFYNDESLNEPMFRIRYYCDKSYHTVFLEVDKIWDGFSNIICESNFAIVGYRGSSLYVYLNYFSEQPVDNFNVKMYKWGD